MATKGKLIITGEPKILLKNIFWNFYVIGTDVYVTTTKYSDQLKYAEGGSEEKTKKEREELRDEILKYFFAFWKTIEQNNDDIKYTLHFDVSSMLVKTSVGYYAKMVSILKSLKKIFKKNLEETFFKIENKFTKSIFKIVMQLYTPVRPIHILN